MNNAIERARKTDKYNSVLIVCVEGSADEFRGGGGACKGKSPCACCATTCAR